MHERFILLFREVQGYKFTVGASKWVPKDVILRTSEVLSKRVEESHSISVSSPTVTGRETKTVPI